MMKRIILLILTCLICFQSLAVRAADSDPEFWDRYQERLDRITTLRIHARYKEALSVADTLRRALSGRKDATADKRGDAVRLVGTLKIIAGLPAAQQFEMSEHDHSIAIADSLSLIKDYEPGLPLLVATKVAREKFLGPQNCETIDVVQYCAVFLDELKHYDEAEQLYRRSLADSRRVLEPKHPSVVTRLFDFASFYRARYRYRDASVLFDQALELARSVRGPMDTDLAYDLENYGGFRLEVGDCAGAREAFQEAFRIHSGNQDEKNIIREKSLLAKAALQQGKLKEANELLQEVLAFYQKDDARGRRTANTLNQLGLVAYQGGDFPRAQQDLEQSLSIKRELDVDPVLLATTLELLGSTHRYLGNLSKAEPPIQEAIGLRTQVFGESSVPVMIDLQELAAIRVQQRRNADAEALLNQAAAIYDKARQDVSSGTDRATFRSSPYEELAAVHLLNGDESAAWSAVENHLARTLKDKVLSKTDATSASMLKQVQASMGPGDAIIGWVDANTLLRSPLASTVTSKKARELPVWGYCIRDKGAVRWERLTPSSDRGLTEALSNLRKSLSNAAEIVSTSDIPWTARIAPLIGNPESIANLVVIPSDDMLGIPVETLPIDKSGRLLSEHTIVSYAPSATVFAWLRKSRSAQPESCGGCLALGDPPFNEEQARDIKSNRNDCTQSDVVRTSLRGDEMPDSTWQDDVRSADPHALGKLRRLNWTRCEATEVSRVFGSTSTLLLGEESSEERIRALVASGSLSNFCVIHMATHGLVDDERPDRSALVLSQVGLLNPADARVSGISLTDGRITVEEIESGWKLNASLVTLSACSSGLGRIAVGEGYLGFSQALLGAGARCVLVSLWKVDDHATAMLMQRFYENWLDASRGAAKGKTKAQALSEAKAWLRASTPYAHPFYWAGFVLVGDGQ